jgi:hypothetical protein
MSVRKLWIVLAFLVAPVPGRAQHGGGGAPVSHTAPREAAQFNFLVGQWELVVKPAATTLAQKIHGTPKLIGTWKAWRALDGFGLEDELRITDKSGNPMSLSHAVRFYDASVKRWKSSSLDVYRGVFTSSLGEMRGTDIVTSSQGTDLQGKPYLSRGRYSDISPNGFRFTQERSTDNGKSWQDNLTIEAKRVSATAAR